MDDTSDSTKPAKRQGSPLPDEEPKPKRSSSRKSARRSSFVQGRISNFHGIENTKLSSDLLSDIPRELPADEKLKRLAMSALEYTLGKLSSEFQDVDGFQQFQVKVGDAASRAVEKLASAGVFTHAAEQSKPATDPLSVAITQARTECKKLDVEVTQWEKLLDKRKEKANKAKTLKAASSENPLVTPAAYHADQPDGPSINYQHVLDRNAQTQLEIELMAEELQNGVHGLKAFLEYTTSYLEHKAQHVGRVSFQTRTDPKQLISQFLSI